jgi:hypothetical protein
MTLYSTHNNPFFVIDLKSLTTENKIMKTLFHKYSENIAGIVSLSGSLILIILGDIKSIMAAIAFTVAELILTRYGNKTFGYSLAALFFIIGNTLGLSDFVDILSKKLGVLISLIIYLRLQAH